jgi:hypothetical protein
MPSKFLLMLVPAAVALLSAAAIEFLPATLYFPVVEYSMPGEIQIAMLRYGELDMPRCERSMNQLVAGARVSCPTCKYVERCVRGLDAAHRRVLSREALATASLRTQNSNLTLTVSSTNQELALSVCRLVAEQAAVLTTGQRLLCFPPSTPR